MNDIFLHVKSLGSIAKQTSSFSARFFVDLQDIDTLWESQRDLTWNLAEILGELFAAEILRSPRDLCENLSKNLSENLCENLGKFLAAEILRSHWDLGKNLGQNLGEILKSRPDLVEISVRISASFWPPRSRSKFCKGMVGGFKQKWKNFFWLFKLRRLDKYFPKKWGEKLFYFLRWRRKTIFESH